MTTTYRSFEDMIQTIYYNDIYSALADYVIDNPRRLECKSREVESPDEAELYEYSIKKVSILDAGDCKLNFSIIVAADIIIYETVKRDRHSADIEQWFLINCSAYFEETLSNFTVERIDIYSKSRGMPRGLLTEQLVPIIEKEMFDREAEEFLQTYYPDALLKPMKLPALEVAAKMGLDVKEVHITRTGAVFGKIFFADYKAEYFDTTDKVYRIMDVRKGTVFVDPKIYFMRNVGSMNNTIIHECVHWHKHKKFHDLVRIYDKQAELISCRVSERIRNRDKWTPIDWMEWQANGIGPRILMPAKPTKQKIEDLIKKNKKILPNAKEIDILESVLFELADFYGVSKISAKIRMIDLGYERTIGVHTYVDNHFISNYAFETGALKKNQTFTISALDACFEYHRNPKFRAYLDSGNYLYIDGHFCINDSKYIHKSESGFCELTDYARDHIDECCLIFDIHHFTNNQYGLNQYLKDIMYRDVLEEEVVIPSFNNAGHNGVIDKRAENLRATRQDLKWTMDIMREMPQDVGEALVYLMKKRDVTTTVLADRTMLTEKDIQRMRNRGTRPKLNKLIAVCIGLNLTPTISFYLLDKSGYKLMLNDEEIAYRFLLDNCYDMSIYDCNNLLLQMDQEPLTSE